MDNYIWIIPIIIMTLSGSLGALYFKKGMTKIAKSDILIMFVTKEIFFGGCFYLIGLVLNIILLRYIEYSVLYPTTALTYIWTIFISRYVLNEKLSRLKIIAIIFIVVGVMMINL